MLSIFSQRLLTVLQLSRMALVFTAITDSLCALMIWAQWRSMDGQPLSEFLNLPHAAAVVARVSAISALAASRTRRVLEDLPDVCTTALLPSCEAPDWLSGREVDEG